MCCSFASQHFPHLPHIFGNLWLWPCWSAAAGEPARASSSLYTLLFCILVKPLCPVCSPPFLRLLPSPCLWNTFSSSPLGKGEKEVTFWNMSYFHTCSKIAYPHDFKISLCLLDITALGFAYETISPSRAWETLCSVSFFGNSAVLYFVIGLLHPWRQTFGGFSNLKIYVLQFWNS